jgi:hypothetical protein
MAAAVLLQAGIYAGAGNINAALIFIVNERNE